MRIPSFETRKISICLTAIGIAVVSLFLVSLWQPRLALALAGALSPEVLFFVETEEKLISFTFDDGPDPSATPRILDLLDRHQARATFFVISGRIEGNEALVARIVSEGHELGNHLTRDEPSILLSRGEFEAELLRAHEVLSGFGELRWLRPGSGWFSAGMIETASAHGYRLALGSIFPFDTHIPSSSFAARHVLHKASPGSIVVLHENGSRGERAIATLARVLPELDRRGYRSVTVSDLVRTSRGSSHRQDVTIP